MDVRVLVGQNVRRLRLQLGLSQDELSERSGFDQRYISQLENGRRNPTIVALSTLAAALECALRDLIVGEEPGS